VQRRHRPSKWPSWRRHATARCMLVRDQRSNSRATRELRDSCWRCCAHVPCAIVRSSSERTGAPRQMCAQRCRLECGGAVGAVALAAGSRMVDGSEERRPSAHAHPRPGVCLPLPSSHELSTPRVHRGSLGSSTSHTTGLTTHPHHHDTPRASRHTRTITTHHGPHSSDAATTHAVGSNEHPSVAFDVT
jgi:hypothetical protein